MGVPICRRHGEYGILCDAHAAPGGVPELAVQRRIWALSDHLSTQPGVIEVVPGMNNLLVLFDHVPDLDQWQAAVRRAWSGTAATARVPRQLVVPVSYGGAGGEDLAAVARHAGLSAEEYAHRHASGVYTVFALGSQPGFAYLGGLDAALAVPRRATPRTRVLAGAVIVGGNQTGILSRTTPSGWHIIGQTTLECFDPLRQPPALLAAGYVVRFQIQAVQA